MDYDVYGVENMLRGMLEEIDEKIDTLNRDMRTKTQMYGYIMLTEQDKVIGGYDEYMATASTLCGKLKEVRRAIAGVLADKKEEV